MEKRQATNISPKNQNGYLAASQDMTRFTTQNLYRKLYILNNSLAGHATPSQIELSSNLFYISFPLINIPNALFLNAWDLFLTPMLSAPTPRYHHEFRNHVSGSLSACTMNLNWEKIFYYTISLFKKEWENCSREENNVQKLILSGGNEWFVWERGFLGNVGNFNQQRERQRTCNNLYSSGTGNEQGKIWRTSRGARDRRQPEDKNSLLLDQGNQVQDKPTQAVWRIKKDTFTQLETKSNWFDHVFLHNIE